jgi:uncharacterized Zn finger protein (UPF0148 family)
MKPNVQYSGDDRGSGELLLEQEIRACPACKAPLTADSEGEFCPICMLRRGLTAVEKRGCEAAVSRNDVALAQTSGN